MKKVVLKITVYEVSVLIGFIEFSLANTKEFGYTKKWDDKHILASLTELFSKLHSAYNPLKANYKIKVDVSQGIALIRHSQRPSMYLPGSDEVTLNKLIGIIDKQI